MNLKVAAKCQSVEKGEDADIVEFRSHKSDPDDVPGTYQVDGVITLTLEKPELRGRFEAGTAYNLDITISPASENTFEIKGFFGTPPEQLVK